MKQIHEKSFEQAGRLIAILKTCNEESSKITRIPVMPNTEGIQFLIGDTTLVLTYQPTSKPDKQVLYEWYAINDKGMREARDLVQDIYRRSCIPSTEEVHDW